MGGENHGPLRRHISDEAIDALNEWTFCNLRLDEAGFTEFVRGLYFIVDCEVRRAVEVRRAESASRLARPSDN